MGNSQENVFDGVCFSEVASPHCTYWNSTISRLQHRFKISYLKKNTLEKSLRCTNILINSFKLNFFFKKQKNSCIYKKTSFVEVSFPYSCRSIPAIWIKTLHQKGFPTWFCKIAFFKNLENFLRGIFAILPLLTKLQLY